MEDESVPNQTSTFDLRPPMPDVSRGGNGRGEGTNLSGSLNMNAGQSDIGGANIDLELHDGEPEAGKVLPSAPTLIVPRGTARTHPSILKL